MAFKGRFGVFTLPVAGLIMMTGLKLLAQAMVPRGKGYCLFGNRRLLNL
jgi:hypothetical protein